MRIMRKLRTCCASFPNDGENRDRQSAASVPPGVACDEVTVP